MKINGFALPRELAYDRGGKGRSEIMGVKILIPSIPQKMDSVQQRQAKRIKHRCRAAIEPIQGHLKSDFRMRQNYLGGEIGVEINALMAACAWNMKKMMGKNKKTLFAIYFANIFPAIFTASRNVIRGF